jgi:hypothetical protein
MKIRPASVFLCATIALLPALRAQSVRTDPFSPALPYDPTGKQTEETIPKHIRVQVEYIELSLAEMTALMADPAAAKSDTVLRKKLDALIENNKARILDVQSVICRSGQKATAESIRGFTYPTEFESAVVPNEVHIHNKEGDMKVPAEKDFATGPTPTAFETRNLGSTLEVEANLGATEQYIDLRLNPEIVYHVGNIKWATWKDRHGDADIQMPVFYTLRVYTSVTVMRDRPCLVAALSPKDDEGVTDPTRKVMVFAKCDVVIPAR